MVLHTPAFAPHDKMHRRAARIVHDSPRCCGAQSSQHSPDGKRRHGNTATRVLDKVRLGLAWKEKRAQGHHSIASASRQESNETTGMGTRADNRGASDHKATILHASEEAGKWDSARRPPALTRWRGRTLLTEYRVLQNDRDSMNERATHLRQQKQTHWLLCCACRTPPPRLGPGWQCREPKRRWRPKRSTARTIGQIWKQGKNQTREIWYKRRDQN